MILCVTLNPIVDTTMFVDEIAPGYRTNARAVKHIAGGKGNNVARTLRLLGVPAKAFQPLGGITGRHEADLLTAEGIDLATAWVSGDTRFVITIVNRDYHQQAIFSPAAPYSEDDLAEIRRCFERALPGADALCLCGSSPGPAVDPLVPYMIRAAAQRGMVTLLDTYGPALPLGLAAAPTIVKANRAEAEAFLNQPIQSLADQLAALDTLKPPGTVWVILTLGAEGALCRYQDRIWRGRSAPVDVINPIGSGDAMSAGLLAGLARALEPDECFRLGMAAAVANLTTWDPCTFENTVIEDFLPLITLETIQ